MPSLRLSDDEAQAITAVPRDARRRSSRRRPTLEQRLADPANIAGGEKLVRKYGCPGCHDIPGMESESRIGAELSTFGGKTARGALLRRPHRHEGRLGHLDVPQDQGAARLRDASGSSRSCRSSTSPTRTSCALRVFLREPHRAEGAGRLQGEGPGEQERSSTAAGSSRATTAPAATSSRARRQTSAGSTRTTLDDGAAEPAAARARRCSRPGSIDFLKAPTPIRPWLQVRMPTFGLNDHETDEVLRATSRRSIGPGRCRIVHVDRSTLDPTLVKAGEQLASPDYLQCFSCHVRGTQNPEGPPDSWAPEPRDGGRAPLPGVDPSNGCTTRRSCCRARRCRRSTPIRTTPTGRRTS